MKKAAIQAVEYYLPPETLTTATLDAMFPEWDVARIDERTGICERHIAAAEICASDLAVEAAKKLFATGLCQPESVEYILFCTETPDHLLPPCACLVQDRLGISTRAGALDFSLGSSGYVYGLGLAQGLIETGQVSSVLLLTADTYSKLIHPRDRSTRTIFGDAATATLVVGVDCSEVCLGPYVYGTDGRGAENLIVPAGGMRRPHSAETTLAIEDENGNVRSSENLYMNGAEIFNFTLGAVPGLVKDMLDRSGRQLADIDLFVFHQANRQMLEHLRKRIHLPSERFAVALSHCGNTVSSSIPIALRDAVAGGRVKAGDLTMLVGFGVGYSWGATLARWIG